jgi:hypothetical protein
MSKKRLQRFHIRRFNLKKLKEVEGKEQCCVEVSNRLAALDNLGTEVDTIVLGKLLKRISRFQPRRL